MGDWHSRSMSQVMEEVGGRPAGLTDREAARRLERYGPNQLAQPQPPGLFLWRRELNWTPQYRTTDVQSSLQIHKKAWRGGSCLAYMEWPHWSFSVPHV